MVVRIVVHHATAEVWRGGRGCPGSLVGVRGRGGMVSIAGRVWGESEITVWVRLLGTERMWVVEEEVWGGERVLN